jgi:Holliday junction resolvase
LNTIKRGDYSEAYVKRLLERRGYSYILRSLGSLTPIDMIASNGLEVLAVQVKQKNYLPRESKQALIEWASHFNARPCLAYKSRGRWVLSPFTPGWFPVFPDRNELLPRDEVG